MLLRIFLIVAILAGIGVIAVSQLKVKPHIEGIIDQREKNLAGWKKEEANRKQKEKELAATTSKLNQTTKELEETQTQLASTKSQFEAEQKRANGLQTNLTKTQADLKAANQDLEAWRLLGIPVEAVRMVIASEKKLRVANDALEEEKKVISTELAKAKRTIAELSGPNEDPEMPVGLAGKVLVVDPKWNFVVLNIGGKQGAIRRGVLLL